MRILDIPIAKASDEQRIVWGWANVPIPGEVAKDLGGEAGDPADPNATSIEDALRQVSAAYQAQYRPADGYAYVVATFPSYVIACVETREGAAYYQHAYVLSGDSVAFGEGVEVEQVWVEKRLGEVALERSARLGKRAEKVDLQDDTIPLAELEKAAYAYMLKSRVSGVNHDTDESGAPRVSGEVVESFFATREKYEGMGVPADVAKSLHQGWWVGFKIHDDEVWEGVKDGTFQMFSIGGLANRAEVDD